jgi:hypothetical protein
VNDAHLERLNHLVVTVATPVWSQDRLPQGMTVDEKDVPIILDAINSQATHLLTGDKRHFGALYGQRVGGVLILPPAEYIASRLAGP